MTKPRRRYMEVKFWPASPERLAAIEERYRKRTPPDTDMQALMEAEPHEEPAESSEAKQDRLAGLRDAMDSDVLDDRERWLLQALFWRGLSLEAAGRELGVSQSTAQRWRDTAMKKLRDALED